MPSKSRDFNPDFFYHIYNCGVEKRNIFLEPYDYERFLETLSYYLYRQPISLAQAKDLSHLNPKGLGARPLGLRRWLRKGGGAAKSGFGQNSLFVFLF